MEGILNTLMDYLNPNKKKKVVKGNFPETVPNTNTKPAVIGAKPKIDISNTNKAPLVKLNFNTNKPEPKPKMQPTNSGNAGYIEFNGKKYAVKKYNETPTEQIENNYLNTIDKLANYINYNLIQRNNPPPIDTTGLENAFNRLAQFNPFVAGLGSFYSSLIDRLNYNASHKTYNKFRANELNSLIGGLLNMSKIDNSIRYSKPSNSDFKNRVSLLGTLSKTLIDPATGQPDTDKISKLMEILFPNIAKQLNETNTNNITPIDENTLNNIYKAINGGK